MTKKRFEELVEKKDFNSAMKALYEESYFLTTYDMLKKYAVHQLNKDNVGFEKE